MTLRGILTGALLSTLSFVLASEVPRYLPAEHAQILRTWLNDQLQSRAAEDADCRCEDDLKRMRTESGGVWMANPGFHPYYVSGDFNRDGELDFAVGIVEGSSAATFRVAIFNGPFKSKASPRPAFLSGPIPLGEALFFGAPRPKPYALVVGAFGSEGAIVKSTASGYALQGGE
jgi:hypothetical protein